MDKELHDLEQELKRLRPTAPSPQLVARIEQGLAAAPSAAMVSRPASIRWIWTVVLPAAAAIAVGLFGFTVKRSSDARDSVSVAGTSGSAVVAADVAESARVMDGTTLKPVAAENLLVAARDEGLVTLDDGTPARRERLQYVDTITWQNPRTHASLTWRVPREEVRVIPVLFQ